MILYIYIYVVVCELHIGIALFRRAYFRDRKMFFAHLNILQPLQPIVFPVNIRLCTYMIHIYMYRPELQKLNGLVVHGWLKTKKKISVSVSVSLSGLSLFELQN